METPNRPNACCYLWIAIVLSLFCGNVRAQQVDIGQYKNEHLITNSLNGETGDVSIYVSFPNWFCEPGYCPIRVRVVPRKGLVFKQSGLLKVTMGRFYFSNFSTNGVVVAIPIEKGTGEATGELLGNFLIEPSTSRGFQFGFSAKLNDRKLPGQNSNVYNSRGLGINGSRSLVLISNESSKDDSLRLEAIAEMGRTGNWFSQTHFIAQSSQSTSFCDVRNLPTNWLCLSSIEQISIAAEDLERIDAKGLESLNYYVLAGGFLAVNRVQSPQTIETYLPIDLSRKYNAGKRTNGTPMEAIVVPHGFGTVCLESCERTDDSNILEGTIGNNLSNSNASLHMSLASRNRTVRLSRGVGDDFWTWLIPSVGRTPAIAFLAFVVLFVGGAVPGIMAWSNRHKRRVWLVVLIPITATICTFFLFSYGLLKDGLGAVSRIRSLAFVDRNGDGLVWSRQTYFAATVSNDGFSLDKETQFNPIIASTFSSLPTVEQTETDGRQKYRGFLPPRLQTQFSIAHPLRKIPILKRGPDQDVVLRGQEVRNASTFKWDKAVFVGENDLFYFASDVAPGAKAKFDVTSREDAIEELKESYKSQPLSPPTDSPSVDQTSLGQVFSNFFGFRYNMGENLAGQITEENVWQKHIGKTSSDKTVLLPGTFVIFAQEAPYVERCLPDVRDQAGLHMIVGRW